MRAVLCKAYGLPGDLVVEDVPSPQPGQGEVLVTVKAAGVNFPDVLMIQNKYQHRPPLPFSPGYEIAGVIKAVGPGVSGLQVGDVIVQVGRSRVGSAEAASTAIERDGSRGPVVLVFERGRQLLQTSFSLR